MTTYKNKSEIILPSPRAVLPFRFTVSGFRSGVLLVSAKLIPGKVSGFCWQDLGSSRSAAERSEACIATRIAFTVWVRGTLDNISVNKIIIIIINTTTMNTSPQEDQNTQMLRDLQQLADWFEYLDALYKDSDLITNDKNVY